MLRPSPARTPCAHALARAPLDNTSAVPPPTATTTGICPRSNVHSPARRLTAHISPAATRAGARRCWTGIAVLGIVEGRCGWLMHEGGHLSLTGNIAIDIALQVVTYGVGCGMSAAFWRNQHNKHHATPQKIGQDVDLDTLPLVAFNADVQNGKQGKLLKNPVVSHWVRLQAWLFAPVTCLIVALGWQLFLHPKHSLRTGRYHELASMAARYAVVAWFATQPQFTVSEVVLGYLA